MLYSQAGLVYAAGYGSAKDINGYRELGLTREKIFIVGKSNKKQQNLASVSIGGLQIDEYVKIGFVGKSCL